MIEANTTPIVDWISIVVPVNHVKLPRVLNVDQFSREFSELIGHELMDVLLGMDGWERRGGRKPYRDGYANDECGVFVWGGGQQTYLVEISGKGCESLRERGLLGFLLKGCWDNLTRLDIAIDLTGVESVQAFAAKRAPSRIKSHSTMVSETGTTCYIGSKRSEQYVRVYRYAEPHPRSQYTRVECVMRKHYAKKAAHNILAIGIAATAQMAVNRYKFEDMPMIENVSETLPAPYRDRSLAKTERWLIKQAAPAFLKLVQQGEIDDPERWLQEYFLTPVELVDAVQPKIFPDRDAE